MKQTGESAARIGPAKRLSTAVYDEVKARILSGDYSPGEWLSVEELCGVFQVSRQPVMEAMRRLSAEWLIEIVPQVGCRVADHDRRAIMDFINTFGEMEGHIAALAADRRTPEQLAHLAEVEDQISRSRSLDREHRALIREFHHTILEMAHSAVLARLCEQMWDFGNFVWSVAIAGSEVEIVEHERETLRRLTDAIRLQNADLARLHMTVWLTTVATSIVRDESEEATGGADPVPAS
jgi:DNA-binding GntR family transcriptional regulator